jgi:hypothetical protein
MRFVLAFLTMATLFFSGSADAALINSTGGAGWTVTNPSSVTSGATTVTDPIPGWGSQVGSSWISVVANTNGSVDPGLYTFETTFTNFLAGQQAIFNFDMLYDNTVEVFFNDNLVAVGSSPLGYALPAQNVAFGATALVGVNTLRFNVDNAVLASGNNPVGLNVLVNSAELSDAPVVPEPVSAAVWAGCAALCFGLKRLRRVA